MSMQGGLYRAWIKLGPSFLPFADAATEELPLGRLLRLSLFQISVGMSSVLLIGTLNRVMIVELGVAAWLVASMVSLPLLFAPLRALIGFRSDVHRSALGWRRVPYIWLGTLLQFGGLAIMPFALIVLSGDTHASTPLYGQVGAAFAFLLVGAGLHTTQTVGLALATDLAPPQSQPRVVALLSLMLLLGMVVSAVGFGALLRDFSQFRLIQVIQGAAMLTMALNCIALWKQEPRNPGRNRLTRQPGFLESWRALRGQGRWTRRLVAIGLGSAAFSMQDILLEPYGGQILGLSVAATTTLTALFAGGGIAGFTVSARALERGMDPHQLAGFGALAGTIGFAAVIFAAPLDSPVLFGFGTVAIGFGSGLFTVGTLTACMQLARNAQTGLVLGIWGAVQASCAGGAVAAGGVLRDLVSGLAMQGALGPTLEGAATGYGVVYLIEIILLFATIAVIGPLVSPVGDMGVANHHGPALPARPAS